MTKNTYIHIPFCTKKCNYCTFTSVDKLTLKNIYTDALLQEIKHYYTGEKQNTIYIGGGTPSLLSINDFENIFELLNFDKNTEITVEVNPESATKEYLRGLRELGVNRLSIGIQSFDDKILKKIGRIHSSQTAKNCINNAINTGFENISCDLIYGLPSQSENNFLQSLKDLINYDIQHISLYGLKIEEGCEFFNKKPDFLPDDDMQADMYLDAIKILKEKDFEQYEISNFSKNGFESKHNLNYWNADTYYGFGLSAHGYQNEIRYSHTKDIEKYIKNPVERIEEAKLSAKEQLEEVIFLGLRKICGINTNEINQKFNIDFDKKYNAQINKYINSNHLTKTQNGYKLTIDGILLSNIIMADFLE